MTNADALNSRAAASGLAADMTALDFYAVVRSARPRHDDAFDASSSPKYFSAMAGNRVAIEADAQRSRTAIAATKLKPAR